MYIMTERGWQALTGVLMPKIAEQPPRYRGKLPPPECLAYIAKLDHEHREWAARRKSLQGDKVGA